MSNYIPPVPKLEEPTQTGWHQILQTTITPSYYSGAGEGGRVEVTNDGIITVRDKYNSQYVLTVNGTVIVSGVIGDGIQIGAKYDSKSTLTGRYVAINNLQSGNVLEVYDRGNLIFSIPFSNLNTLFYNNQTYVSVGISPNGKYIVLSGLAASDGTSLLVIVYST